MHTMKLTASFRRPELDLAIDIGWAQISLHVFHWGFGRITDRETSGHDSWILGPVALVVW